MAATGGLGPSCFCVYRGLVLAVNDLDVEAVKLKLINPDAKGDPSGG